MDIIEIEMGLIDEDTAQPRYQFAEESLQELVQSIEELGLLSPIKVRKTDGRYKIIYGNRRYKACQTLGLQKIPCIVSDVTDELEIYLEQVAENLTREDFSPIEEAEAFNKLMNHPKFTSSTKYLSSKLGKPETYIKNKLDLLKFDPAVQQLIIGGTEITEGYLTEDQLKPIKDLPIEHRDSLALIVAKDGLPVSDVKKIARLFKDKNISSNTKGKLLYKSGRELLDTWSVYEQNKAERAKPSQPPQKPAKSQNMQKSSSETAAEKPTVDASIETRLRQMLSSLPKPGIQTSDQTDSLAFTDADVKEKFLGDLDLLIVSLEEHLTEWKKVKEQVKSSSNS